jgi:hypothetical protein
MILGRHRFGAGALGCQGLQHRHGSLKRSPVGLAQGGEALGEPGITRSHASCQEVRTGRGRHDLDAATVAGVRLPGDQSGRFKFVGEARRRRGGQALKLGELADAEGTGVHHAGEPRHLRDAELGGIMAAELAA